MNHLIKMFGVWMAAVLILTAAGCQITTTEYDLTVTVNGSGSASPSSGTYEEDTTVTLTATPASGWVFTGWSGDVSGTSSTIQVVMDSDKDVVANFSQTTSEQYSLTVDVSGSGSVSSWGGTYDAGTSVTLTATPDSGWVFTSWSGDVSGTSTTVTVVMNSDKDVTANFSEQNQTDTVTTLQAENASIVSGAVESEHTGYTGSGYANTDNATGNYIEFTLTTTQADTYDLTFTYALSSGNRYGSIQVNSLTQVSTIDFNGTGAWTTWGTSSATVAMDEGVNTVRVTAEQSGGLPNMDKMDVYGPAVTEGDTNGTDPDDPEDPEDGDIILSPGGNLQNAVDSIKAGRTIWLNGGTYNMSDTIMISESNAGTSSARKTIAALNGTPVLDWNWTGSDNSSARGIVLDGSYWHIKGVTIREAGDNGILLSGDNNIVERCTFIANRDTGLQISRYNSSYSSISQWPSNNQVIQCESYDNCDTDGEDADGFAAKLTVGEGNVFRGCYSHNNIDDGWDLYTKTATGKIGAVTITDCISYKNGTLTNGTVNTNGDRNGFKLGGEDISVNHIVHHCMAVGNGKHGFTYNRNLGYIDFYNNTAYNNASRNFNFDGGNTIFMNNVSLNSGSNDRIIGSSLSPYYNAWWSDGSAVAGNGVTVTSADFQSLSVGTVTWVSDYGVNLGTLLIPRSGSDLIGTGLNGANMGAR